MSGSSASPKKRKRSTFEDDSSISPEPEADSYARVAVAMRGTPAGSPLTLEEDASQIASADEEDRVATVDEAAFPIDESPQRKSLRPAPTNLKHLKGKRKGRKTLDELKEEHRSSINKAFGGAIAVEQVPSDEAMSSNGEEAEVDEGHDPPEQENVGKTEEGRE